jgi:hypothetical protein
VAKVTLSDITAGYASASALNASFNAIEDEFNNKVLYRNNPSGEPNQMENDLDMNGNDILKRRSIISNKFNSKWCRLFSTNEYYLQQLYQYHPECYC